MFKRPKVVIIIIVVFLMLTIGSIFLINKVKINYDATQYLSDESLTKETLAIIEEEFGSSGSLIVMVEKESTVNEDTLKVNGINSVTKKANDDYTLYMMELGDHDYSDLALEAVKEITEILDNSDCEYYITGQAYLTTEYNRMIREQIPLMILLIVPVALLILMMMTTSFISPIIFIIVLGIAIVLNMGTNAMFSSISYMTYSICAILQFAVCMDYSVMLLHRYQSLREDGTDKYEAMAKAWKTSLKPILASGITTMCGFAALMFMQYKIGLDIGLVLVKGVLITLITVLLLLPCVILILDPLLLKTKHRTIIQLIRKKHNTKRFIAIPIVTIIVFVASVFIQSTTKFTYGENSSVSEIEVVAENYKKVEEQFGLSQQTLILIDKDKDTTDIITGIENIKVNDQQYLESIISYDKQLSKAELNALISNIPQLALDLLYQNKETISIKEVVAMLRIYSSPYTIAEMKYVISNMIPIDQGVIEILYSLNQKESLSVLELLNILDKKLDQNELAILTSVFPQQIMNNLVIEYPASIKDVVNSAEAMTSQQLPPDAMYQILNGSIDMAVIQYLYKGNPSMSIFEFLALEELNNIPEIQPLIIQITKISSIKTMIDQSTVFTSFSLIDPSFIEGMFLGNNYQRIILNVKLKEEDETSFAYFQELENVLSQSTDDYHIASSTYSVMDIKETSKNDYLITTLISVALIILILLITFKKVIISFVLIFLIEGAIFMNMAVQAIINPNLIFMGFIIVSCIQLGSTIDYGILFTSRFLEHRKTEQTYESINHAYDDSVHSIITSGLILSLAGFVLAISSKIPVIAKMGSLLGVGGLFSMIIILFTLPQMLIFIDKIKFKSKKSIY